MLYNFTLLNLVALLFSIPRLQAEPLELLNFPALQAQLYSQPGATAARAAQDITNLDPTSDSLRWMRSYWIMATAADYTFDESLMTRYDAGYKKLDQAIRIASDQNLLPEYLQLRAIQIYQKYGHSEKSIQPIQDLLAEPKVKNSSGYEAFLYSELAWIYMRFDRFDESFKALQKAYSLTLAYGSTLASDKMRVQNDLGLLLASTGQLQRGLSILLDLEKDCTDHLVYYICGAVTYNIGQQYRQLGNKYIEQEIHYYQKSIELAEKGGDTSTMGVGHIGLAEAEKRRNAYERSVAESTKGVELLEKTTDQIWLAKALLTRSEGFAVLGQLREAEQDIKRAEAMIEPEDSRTTLLLLEMKAKLLDAQHEWKSASKVWAQLHQRNVEAQRDRQAKNLATATAALGMAAEEQKSIRLQQEVTKKDIVLKAQQKQLVFVLAILGIAFAALTASFFALQKSKEVKRSREKMKRILDNIDEGILTIGLDQKVESEFSPALRKLLPHIIHLNGLDFVSGVLRPAKLSSEDRSILQATLSMILGEDSIGWDFNSGNLIREVAWETEEGDRIVTIDWSPIHDSMRKIQTVLVTLRDVTEHRSLEAQIQFQERHAQTVLHRVLELQKSSKELLVPFLTKFGKFMQDAKSWEAQHLASLKRTLHTFKGEARGLGLKTLSQVIHDTESGLLEMSANQISPDVWRALAHELQEYETLTKDFALDSKSSAHAKSFFELVALKVNGIDEVMKEHQLQATHLVIDDQFQKWTPELLEALSPILMHAITNAIDHGFIRASTAQVALRFDAKCLDGLLQLSIRDNGQGLNWGKIEAIAKSKGFIAEHGQTLADCLFLDGVSTAENVSQTSGRGVGLSVIADLCKRLGGAAHIRDNDLGRGAMLELFLPVDFNEKELSA